MVQVTIIILSFLFSALCILINCLLYHQTKKINLIITFIFALIIFNGIIPIFLINEAISNGFSYSLNIIEGYNVPDIFLYYSQNVILLISTVFGWLIIKKNPQEIMDSVEVYELINLNYEKIRKSSIFLLILSIVSYYIYSRAYGGFIGLLDYTSTIRSGIIRVNNPFSFLQKFGGFSVFSTLLFSGLMLEKNHTKKDLLWLIFSVGFSIYYLYSLGGRASLVTFFATLILGCILYRHQNKITIRFILEVGAIAIGVILGLYYITNVFTRASANLSIIDFFIHELSFPFASFKIVSNSPGVFMFKHVMLAPLYFLPSSIWNAKLGFDTASSFNTFLFMGARKGESGVTGSVPLDILSFSWLEGGVFGALVIGILYGMLLAVLQKKINEIPNKGVKSVVFSYSAIEFAVMIVNYGDTVHIIQGGFAFIIGFIILMFFLEKSTSNMKKNDKYLIKQVEIFKYSQDI